MPASRTPPRRPDYRPSTGLGPAVVACLLCCGCAEASDRERFEPQQETVSIVRTVPEAGEAGIGSDVQIDLCWSDLLDPLSIGDLAGTVSSGRRVFDADLELQLFAWRGPQGQDLSETTEAPWCSGSVLSITPVERLELGARHRLRLWAEPLGWSGESVDLDGPGWTTTPEGRDVFYLEFDVTAEAQPPAPPEEQPADELTLRKLFEEGGVFDPKRGLCSCHTERATTAQTLLDLSNPEVAYSQLVTSSRIRETGFTMVTPRRPSESFLVHKLLRDSDGSAIDGVLGHPMPRGPDPIPYPDLVDIAEWIEAGAKL